MFLRRYAIVALALLAGALRAAEVKIDLPLERSNYQANERIALAVVRSAPEALAAGDLVLTLAGADGGALSFTFPVAAAAVVDKEARSVEHVQINGWLLRPGRYRMEARVDGATAAQEIAVFSPIRGSSFRLAAWGSTAREGESLFLGEHSLGFNTLLSGCSAQNSIAAGADQFRNCVMGGAHQMDIRTECDWSDPYVLRGAAMRVTRQAQTDRVSPNSLGIHFYDEPGLTWWHHPKTGEWTPNDIPPQMRACEATGKTPLAYKDVDPANPASAADWYAWGRWKLGFLEAAWKYGQYGLQHVNPNFLACNQAVYAWFAFTDGYYFNTARALPINLGHGGYDDLGSGYLYPSYTFEMGRLRDLNKPNWYLPTWYREMSPTLFRLEQYLSFMDNLQGMMTPPWQTVHRPTTATMTAGVVESNKQMARLGTIFTAMPVNRPPVAMLYSLSHCLYVQARNMQEGRGGRHAAAMHSLYLASKQIQTPFSPVVEEDILDGTLAAFHRVIVLGGIQYLDPRVVAALEAYAASGNTVLLTDDCTVAIKGATRLGCAVDYTLEDQLAKARQDKDPDLLTRIEVAGSFMKSAAPLAKALKDKLATLNIQPVFECDNASIAATRQADGDVEYLFAANIAYDSTRWHTYELGWNKNQLKPNVASLRLKDDGRPVYDAIHGEAATAFQKDGGTLAATLRFGPGQMKAFARTARTIGGVQVGTPVVRRDLTLASNPITVQLTAAVADTDNRPLTGAFPLAIRVIDPAGGVRYDLYRATDKGQLRLDLPLVANDPAGTWTVTVGELLSGKHQTVSFDYTPARQCGALAGVVSQAVLFEQDRETIFRFFRTFRDVTIVKGSSPYNVAAAERLVRILKPWNVNGTIVDAAQLAVARPVAEEAAPTLTGLMPGKAHAGESNTLTTVGFALRTPAILLGTPEDNPLIKFAQDNRFLPYKAGKNFPGPRRGYLAWQLDAVNHEQESITAIAYDEAGMTEAVSTLYELAAGMQPLMALTPPAAHTVTPAGKSETPPEAAVAWKTVLPDNAVEVRALADGALLVLSLDGQLARLDADGKRTWATEIDGGERWALDVSANGALIVVGASHHVVGLNGKGQTVFDVPTKFNDPRYGDVSPVVRCVTIANDGARVAVATASGRLMLLDAKGKNFWSVGEVSAEAYAQYRAELKTWDAGAEQRASEFEAFKKANEAFKTAEAEWKRTKMGDKPTAPVAPKPAPRPQEPKGEIYTACSFANDGRWIVALSAHGLTVIDAATGAVLHQENGIKPLALTRFGDNFLATDGAGKLAAFSPTEQKIVSQVQLGEYLPDAKGSLQFKRPLGIARIATDGTNVFVGGETVPAVQVVKSFGTNPVERITWQRVDETRLVKHIAAEGNRVALAYWGGYTVVLDAANGAVKSAQALPQDVTALVWQKGRLIAALADGTVLALDVK